MKPSHVKVVVVVAVTAVGADVRAEDEAGNGGGVGGEGATKRPCSPFCAPSPAAVAGLFHWYDSVLGASALEIENPLCSNHCPHASTAQCSRLQPNAPS